MLNSGNQTAPMTTTAQPAKKENVWLNLTLNVLIPTLVLMKLSGDEALGTQLAIVVALSFPIGYGLMDYRRTGKMNFFSALGVFSVVMTGGISLLELDPKYIAYKEAGIPALFGIATLVSLRTRYPLVRTFLYNDKVLQIDKVSSALKEHRNESRFDIALAHASHMVAFSFFLSSALNYGLAKYLLVSPPGTEEFNAELGKMTALSFPVIAVPATLVLMGALLYLFKRIKDLTQLDLDDIIVEH